MIAGQVAKRARVQLPLDEEAELASALNEWKNLVLSFGPSCDLHEQMAEDPPLADTSFRAAFHGKPAGTLRKRATALRQFLDWGGANGREVIPVSEQAAFAYVHHLASTAAPPTRGQSFKEAIGFARASWACTGPTRCWPAGGSLARS